MARDTPRSFRAPTEVFRLLDAQAARDELSYSAWLREVIVAISTSGLTLAQLVDALGISKSEPAATNGHHRWYSPNPRLGRTVIARSCLHPPHLLTRYPTFDRCVCGQERYR